MCRMEGDCTYLCDKARSGKPCQDFRRVATSYIHQRGSASRDDTPSPVNPPTPTSSGTYLTQRRRPSNSGSRPSTHDGQRINPEIIIEYGSKKGKVSKYPSLSVSAKTHKRHSPGSFGSSNAAVDSGESEASYTLRTGFPEAPLPPAAFDQPRTFLSTPSHGYYSRHIPSASSSQTPSLLASPETDFDPSAVRRGTRPPAPIIHHSTTEPASPTWPQHGLSSGSYKTKRIVPRDPPQVTQAPTTSHPLNYDQYADHFGSSRASSGIAEASRPTQNSSQRRKKFSEDHVFEDVSRKLAGDAKKLENDKHVRFELGRYEARERERAERNLAEKEKERAAIREQERERKRLEQEKKEREERKRLERLEQEERERKKMERLEQEKKEREREEQRAKDRKKEISKPQTTDTTKLPSSSRRMTAQEQAEQQRLLEADTLFVQREKQAAEAREREERIVAARQQQEPSEVKPGYITCHVGEDDWGPTTFYETRKIKQTSALYTNLVENSDDNIGRYDPETMPASPSCASSVASVFSAGSLASSATGLSRSSGYSAVQIASATKVLLSVFQEDASLLPLYTNAMNNPHIGPDRLRRNLRRIFKAYSKQLEGEAKDRIEFHTSQLVMTKSGLLADSIVEKLQTAQVTHLISNDEHKDESSDEDGDEGAGSYPVNEEAFEDLGVFREFLVKSEAFQNLHTQVQVFVTGKSTQTTNTSTMDHEKLPARDELQQCLEKSAAHARRSLTWENWVEDVAQTIDGLLRDTSITSTANSLMFLFIDAFMLATDGFFIALGQLEPALKPGMTRLRWQCSCGDRLYSDVLELRAGGISKLASNMQRTSRVRVHVSSYNQQNSVQQYIAPCPVRWILSAGRKVWVALGRATQQSTWLPQYNTQCRTNTSTTTTNNSLSNSNSNTPPSSNSNTSSTSNINASSISNNNTPHQKILHVLACMHRDRVRISLNQDRIEDVTTDRDLICFLREQYMRNRGSILRLISLKGIQGLFFVRFRLTKGGEVLLYHHRQCCVAASSVSMTCGCIPPAPKVEPSPGAEYRCTPGPPETYPPIPPAWLANLITCRKDRAGDDTFILDQLPRRTCGKLQGQIGKPAEGWGVYYQEAWDRHMITLAILILLLVVSLLFAILWSRYRMDIQGAFGVASWITGICAVLWVVVADYADNKG